MKGAWWIAGFCLVLGLAHVATGAKSDAVLLENVKALTLHQGQMTNGRRSNPVPQLKCVGGSAGCDAFRPLTVQCQNRGSDGVDIQWECKADMDNMYRFGKLAVSCEGYDYPDDPYILKGSCGLEYTLELTQEGYERQNSQQYGSHGNQHSNQHDNDYHYRPNSQSYTKKGSSIFQDLIYLGIIAGLIYIVYKTCIAPTPAAPRQPPSGDPPSYEDTFGRQGNQGNQQPPPYGFRQDYMPNTGSSGGSCSSGAGQTYTQPPGGSTNTGGGWWSGLFSGGVLGYMMGNRNNGYYTHQRPHTGWFGGRQRGWGNGWGTGWGTGGGTGWGTGWGSNWGTGTGGGWGSSSRTHTTTRTSSTPRSTGTRTASGFASTSRR